MAKLSSSIDNIRTSYDVVVVGSGYGGSISASRLARAGRSVCLLERGREIEPGAFPETDLAALRELQVDAPEGRVGSTTGMLDLHVNDEVSVLVGCGLGGTSLINAGVALRPDKRVFDDGRWPRLLARDSELLDVFYLLAEHMLGSRPYPDSFPRLPKMEANRRSALKMGVPLHIPPINVTFEDGKSSAGVDQKACILCGNCVTGCNHLAKNTVCMNYLPDAHNHGAEIYCGVEVRHVEKHDGEWVVHYQLRDASAPAGAPTLFVRAKVVVLAAGTLGSTEILLRSRERGLPLSNLLGHEFSGNGDMLAFAYDCQPDVNGIGFAGDTAPGLPVGPTITSAIDLRGHADVKQDVLIEEGAIPSAIAGPTAAALFALAKIEDLVRGPTAPPEHRSIGAAAAATQTYLVMSLDDDRGEVLLRDDRVRVDWPHAGREPDLRRGNAEARAAAAGIEGQYIIDPLWSRVAGKRLITVHPIGGSTMGDDASKGVVDDRCQVFAGTTGTDVHEGLFVCDGSVIPSPLGVNPLLTISAITERACHYLTLQRAWQIDYSLPRAKSAAPPAESTVGVRFTEVLSGHFQAGAEDDFTRAEKAGEASGSSLHLVLDVEADDLEALLQTPGHRARLVGTAQAPTLSGSPLTITDGTLDFFVEEPDRPGVRLLRYGMRLTTESGREIWLSGEKRVGHDSPLDAWSDSTTLFATLHDGRDAVAPVLGRGIVRDRAADVAKLLGSITPVNAHGLIERAGAVLRFARFFLGKEVETYLRAWKLW